MKREKGGKKGWQKKKIDQKLVIKRIER